MKSLLFFLKAATIDFKRKKKKVDTNPRLLQQRGATGVMMERKMLLSGVDNGDANDNDSERKVEDG